jgi:hypothetical protein
LNELARCFVDDLKFVLFLMLTLDVYQSAEGRPQFWTWR